MIVRLNRTMSLIDQISYAKNYILKCMKSLEKPFNVNYDILKLTKCETAKNEHIYHYAIYRNARGIEPIKGCDK